MNGERREREIRANRKSAKCRSFMCEVQYNRTVILLLIFRLD